ncbi:inositol monophosphatase family protein, partial [Streptomyces sp. NPDC052196]|uniref:inositol monophosphatase family protein n=1 Tax=Streptomyces sp. NPDC052196 TaxID=3156691 RepID=UPI003445C9B1
MDVADSLSAQAFRNRAYTVSYKADGSPVLDVEVGIEREVGRRIRAAFPGDGILGEELGGSSEADRLWVVDPVDGTANFVEGVPIYAHMICYVRGGWPLFAAVSAPLLGRRWWAVAGQGAFEGGRRLSVSDVPRLAEAR